MSLVKWSPFRDLEEVADHYGRLFPAAWPRFEPLDKEREWKPAADIIERKNEYVIKADLPEVKKEDVEITLENGVLTVKGERRTEETKEDEKLHRVETFYGGFARSFRVPEDVDTSAISAETKDGVLRVHLPKTEQRKPEAVRIAIR